MGGPLGWRLANLDHFLSIVLRCEMWIAIVASVLFIIGTTCLILDSCWNKPKIIEIQQRRLNIDNEEAVIIDDL